MNPLAAFTAGALLAWTAAVVLIVAAWSRFIDGAKRANGEG